MTVAYYASLRIMPHSELFDTCTNGIKIMVPVLAMLLALFVFVEANDRIGLTEYVIQAVKPYMTATWLPVIIFITMSAVSFATGSNWGVIAIAMPVAFPLAQAYGRQHSACDRRIVICQRLWQSRLLLFGLNGVVSARRGLRHVSTCDYPTPLCDFVRMYCFGRLSCSARGC